MTMETLIWLIPLPPLLAFFTIWVAANRRNALSHWIAVGAAGLSWLGSMVLFFAAAGREGLAEHPIRSTLEWLPTGSGALRIGLQIDPLSAVSLFFVAWTILAIFVYSIGYHNYGQPKGEHDCKGLPPHGAMVRDSHGHEHTVPSIEPMYARFFAFFGLFAFAMYLLVLSDNLLLLYIGWEIMGLCSYLLIGFWYGKPSARDAAVKAFMTTRIGDVFMLIGLAYLYSTTGTLGFQEILQNPEVLRRLTDTSSGVFGLSAAAFAGLLLFMGTVGKSSQFPLHVWLPDAMEGPTPVSAMIHAATMVSAGVYLSIRIFPLLSAGWSPGETLTPAMGFVACIGAFTALFAATIAVGQRDIKRVLAYSTISQLGYMVAAVGVGAYAAAAFHLFTHAFFKALLFLGSGSVIHGMEHGVLHTGEHIDAQDMFQMGGLRKKMPVTFWTFLLGGLALAGFPLVTAGFWSKDAVLGGAYNGGQMLIFLTLALAALLTAFYTMRQITLVFLGKPRSKAAEHAQENKWTMTAPLAVLSVFAVAAGWLGIPKSFPVIGGLIKPWLEEFLAELYPVVGHGAEAAHSVVPVVVSIFVSLGGLYLGWLVYRGVQKVVDPLKEKLGRVYTWLENKYYIDELYDRVFIRPSRWIAEVFTVRWMDGVVIDGILHGIARGAAGLGNILRHWIDLPIWNKGGDMLGEGVKNSGSELRKIQTGRVQQYMITAVLAAAVLGALFIYYLWAA